MVPNTLSLLFLLASLASACEFPRSSTSEIPTPTPEATPPPSARSHLLMGRLISARPSEGGKDSPDCPGILSTKLPRHRTSNNQCLVTKRPPNVKRERAFQEEVVRVFLISKAENTFAVPYEAFLQKSHFGWKLVMESKPST
ncbi:hypothetical protein QJS10_CPA16g00393 [Acorus calamus]|uniref:Uncharacterized protein n=1 Tax=Acorus calamus TaxID=4465 RepID=A0AAV9D2S2_ACOCL|nr:hypothetical protein QJS10_CPA16g00393 [Acorus calamus]